MTLNETSSITDVWFYLDGIKREAVKRLPEELWIYVKQECDDLFHQVSGNNSTICPAWWIGGFPSRIADRKSYS